MKIKWVIISIVGLGILTTLIIGSVMFIQDFNKDNKETLKVMDKIRDEYKNFSPIVEEFSSQREKFYKMKEEVAFLETFEENREEFENIISEYNDLVNKVNDDSAFLQGNCKIEYANESVNNACNLFKQGYEAVMNYCLVDIEVYNKFVKEYNDYISENQLEVEPLKTQKFCLYEKYIDYDNDKTYLGGKENEEE